MPYRHTLILLLALTPSAVRAQSTSLPRATPESQGVSSSAIRQFIETADREVNSMHSFMLLRHGKVVAEAWWAPESAEKPHVLWSLSKSFTSTAVGLAVEDGKLSLNDSVLKFFPKDARAEVSRNLKAMRVRDLLTMNAGHQNEVNWRVEKHWAACFCIQHFETTYPPHCCRFSRSQSRQDRIIQHDLMPASSVMRQICSRPLRARTGEQTIGHH